MTGGKSGVERELKLGVWPEFAMPDLGRAVKGGSLGSPVERRLDATYYDAPDLRLLRRGITLRLRHGESPEAVWTVKLPGEAATLGLARREISMPGRPGPVPQVLGDITRGWALGARLGPVARIVTTRRSVPLLDATGEPVATIDDDDVAVLHAGHVVARFRELEVELAAGAPEKLLTAVAKRLRAAGAEPVPQVPKLVHALGPAATEPRLLAVAGLGDRPTAADALGHRLTEALAGGLVDHHAAVVLGDEEGLRMARGAVRRIAADLRAFAPVLDAAIIEPVCVELGWLDAVLARRDDAGRLLSHVHAAADGPGSSAADERALRSLVASIDAERDLALELVQRTLRGRRYRDLLVRLSALAADPPLTSARARRRPLADVAPQCVRRALRDVRKTMPTDQASLTDEALARAGPSVERLGSALAVAGVPARRAAQDVERLGALLAAHHDACAAAGALRSVAATDTAWVAGMLAGMQLERAAAHRQAAADAWRAVARKSRWAWLD